MIELSGKMNPLNPRRPSCLLQVNPMIEAVAPWKESASCKISRSAISVPLVGRTTTAV
jgi:hypothetical protein